MIWRYKYSSFFSSMLSFLRFLFVLIICNQFIRCRDDHMLVIKGTKNKEKQFKFFLKKCALRNKEECNKFIISLKKMTGDLKQEYNSDENLCLMYRESYANEKDINWGDVKACINKHVTSGKMDKKTPTILKTPKEIRKKEPLFEIPLEWKHGMIENSYTMTELILLHSINADLCHNYSFRVHDSDEDIQSKTKEIANSQVDREKCPDMDPSETTWWVYPRKKGKEPFDHSKESETDSSSTEKESQKDLDQSAKSGINPDLSKNKTKEVIGS